MSPSTRRMRRTARVDTTTLHYFGSRAKINFHDVAPYVAFLGPAVHVVSYDGEKEYRRAEANNDAYVAKLVKENLQLHVENQAFFESKEAKRKRERELEDKRKKAP